MAAKQGLLWPIEDDQRGTVTYDDSSDILEITVPEKAGVRAVATGTISLVAGDWLQMTSAQHVVVYMGIQNISVAAGESVAAGNCWAIPGQMAASSSWSSKRLIPPACLRQHLRWPIPRKSKRRPRQCRRQRGSY